jgi:hypothetical protein
MSFEIKERIVAISPTVIQSMYPYLLEKYGEVLPDGKKNIVTIGAHWDDAEKTKMRAASLVDGTIVGLNLNDGRVAFKCLWQSNLIEAFNNGEISEVEEITEKQLNDLTTQTDEAY